MTLYQYASKTKSWSIKATSSSSSTGGYAFTGLTSGSYRVAFIGNPGWFDEYFDGKSTLATADTLVLSNGTTLYADAALAPEPGTLSGTVTAPEGTPLSGVTVELYSAAGTFVAASTTAADGTYAFSDLTPVGYKVGYEAGPEWVAEYFDDAPALGMAAVVLVPAGGTADADAVLAPAPGAVTGTVTSAAGSPLSGTTVKLYGANGAQLATSVTAADGAYVFTGVTAGQYKVGFEAGSAWIAEYYDDAPTLDAASGVTVGAGQTAVADASLAPAPGTVAGSVTGPDGSILNDITAKLYTSNGEQVASSVTGTGGAYAFTGLTAGDYKVGFDGGAAWTAEYYDDAPTLAAAGVIAVAPGQTTFADAALAPAPGTVAGTVTSAEGAPLGDVIVKLYGAAGVQLATSVTASDGAYAFTGLPAGEYKVGFDAGDAWVAEYHENASTLTGADVVAVGAGQTAIANASLAAAPGTVSGLVTAADGSYIADVAVKLYTATGTELATSVTAADGAYAFTGLAAGDYKLRFEGGGAWLSEYYNDASTLAAATVVTVGAGQTAAADAVVAPAPGTVAGSVTGIDGSPLVGLTVKLYTAAGDQVASSVTTTGGAYAFTGLAAGDYKVRFEGGSAWLSEYYSDASTLAAAGVIAVAPGRTTLADAALAPAPGAVTGTVTSAAGSSLSGATVKLYGANGAQLATCVTGADGAYAFGDLVAGQYKVGFEAGSAWVAEYYDDASTLDTASGVTVGAGQTAVADAVLAPAPGTVAGSVTGPDGSILSGITVQLYAAAGDQVASSVTTTGGAYAFTGLAAGDYKVRFEGGDAWLSEYYSDASTLAAATVVTVGAGQTAAADAALSPAPGVLAGTVTSTEGAPMPGITVKLYSATGTELATSVTATGGAYAFTGLTAGNYKVGFDGGQAWIAEYYNDSSTLDAATAVAVTAGATAVADASLASAPGALAGTVTSSDGSPLSGIRVELYMDDLGGYSRILSTYSAADGTYSFGELVADDYKVGFVDESGVYAAEYHGGSASLAGAAVVTVGAGATVAGIDGILDRPGSISGVFSYSDGSSVTASSPVDAFRLEGDQWVPVEFTLAGPGYTFSELPSGTYRVRGKVWDSVNRRLVESWYGGATLETATDIVLAPGQVFTGADIVFPRP